MAATQPLLEFLRCGHTELIARPFLDVVHPEDAPRLARTVGELLGDRSRLGAMARASASLARPDAARDVAGELLAVASRR